jgi:mRNA interferase YafQ
MFSPQATSRFKKDLKGVVGDLETLLKVTGVMQKLLAGEKLPQRFRPHKLSGDWNDHWECHVKPDLLLIWLPDAEAETLTFVRLGSHGELFGE